MSHPTAPHPGAPLAGCRWLTLLLTIGLLVTAFRVEALPVRETRVSVSSFENPLLSSLEDGLCLSKTRIRGFSFSSDQTHRENQRLKKELELGFASWLGRIVLDRRVQDDYRLQTVTDADGSTSTILWNMGNVLSELLTGGAEVNFTLSTPEMDSPLERSPTTTGHETLLTDHLQTALATIDDTGAVVRTTEYTAYGGIRGGADPGTLGFAGARRDPKTGLYSLRNRWYDPQMGRFVSRDPEGFNGDLNVYAYAAGNPIGHVDPLGLQAIAVPARIIRFPPRARPRPLRIIRPGIDTPGPGVAAPEGIPPDVRAPLEELYRNAAAAGGLELDNPFPEAKVFDRNAGAQHEPWMHAPGAHCEKDEETKWARFANLDTSSVVSFNSEGSPVRWELEAYFAGKVLFLTQAADGELRSGNMKYAGPSETARTAGFLATRVIRIPNWPSAEFMALPYIGQGGFSVADMQIFGTGHRLGIPTVTSNRAIKRQVIGRNKKLEDFRVYFHDGAPYTGK